MMRTQRPTLKDLHDESNIVLSDQAVLIRRLSVCSTFFRTVIPS